MLIVLLTENGTTFQGAASDAREALAEAVNARNAAHPGGAELNPAIPFATLFEMYNEWNVEEGEANYSVEICFEV